MKNTEFVLASFSSMDGDLYHLNNTVGIKKASYMTDKDGIDIKLEDNLEIVDIRPKKGKLFEYEIVVRLNYKNKIQDKILDIDYLRNNNIRCYNFGLGFVQIVLNDIERVHFYSSDKSLQTNEEIHNHRYNFTSQIIKGSFTNNLYDLNFSHDICTHIMTNESCNKDKPITNVINIPVNPILVSSIAYSPGESYNIGFNQFHTVDWSDNTITYLKRSSIINDFAQVVIDKDIIPVCPFENKLNEKEIWEIVESIINN